MFNEGHVRVDVGSEGASALGLGLPDGLRLVHDLALQVGEGNRIVVDYPERADAGSGEIGDHRAAEAARADYQHLGGLELLLARTADALEHQVPRVTPGLVGTQHLRLPWLIPAPRRSTQTRRRRARSHPGSKLQ